MERLTNGISEKGTVLCNYKNEDCNDSCMHGTCKWSKKALNRLVELEDKLEQGLMIELPCKVGDTVYVDNRTLFNNYCYSAKYYEPCEVIGIRITRKQKLLNIAPHKAQAMNTRYHEFYPFSALGKTVFLTESEAQAEIERRNYEKESN